MNEMEEWLSGMTRIGGGAFAAEDGNLRPSISASAVEQTADSLQALQQTIQAGEEDRQASNQNLSP